MERRVRKRGGERKEERKRGILITFTATFSNIYMPITYNQVVNGIKSQKVKGINAMERRREERRWRVEKRSMSIPCWYTSTKFFSICWRYTSSHGRPTCQNNLLVISLNPCNIDATSSTYIGLIQERVRGRGRTTTKRIEKYLLTTLKWSNHIPQVLAWFCCAYQIKTG